MPLGVPKPPGADQDGPKFVRSPPQTDGNNWSIKLTRVPQQILGTIWVVLDVGVEDGCIKIGLSKGAGRNPGFALLRL